MVVEMTDKLGQKLLNGKDKHRDIASLALKTIIAEASTPAVAQSIHASATQQLIKGITDQNMITEIKCESLDILCDVLHKFVSLMANDHEQLLNALLSQLSSNQASVRKNSVSCIASLASSLSDGLLAKETVQVVRTLSTKGTKPEMIRTNIHMIGALSRAVGYRFGPLLEILCQCLLVIAQVRQRMMKSFVNTVCSCSHSSPSVQIHPAAFHGRG